VSSSTDAGAPPSTAPPSAARPTLPGLAAVMAKAGQENFPVALRVLPTRLRDDLLAIYGFARFVDDIGDESDAPTAERLASLDLVDADLDSVFASGTATLAPLLPLVGPVRAGRFTEQPLRRLVEANRMDQQVSTYATFAELRHYCTLSADPVGRLVLGAFGFDDPDRIGLSDDVCTGLQLAEHWQDVAEDHARGRVYLPQEDMVRFGVVDADLAAGHANPALRALLSFEVARARTLLASGPALVDSLTGRRKLAIAGFVAGGRAALDAIAAVDFDVLPAAPKPAKPQLARHALSLLRGAR
jgi:squalene synthase HpnC